MSFYVFRPKQILGVCVLEEPANVEDFFEAKLGVSRSDGWPDDAICRMDDVRKRDVGLADCLVGTGAPIISTRLKQAIEAAKVTNCELLPIAIKTRTGRIVARDFYVLNPLDTCNCIDLAKSKPTFNSIDTTQISLFEALVINPRKVPKKFDLFRATNHRAEILIRSELADRLSALDYSGFKFVDPLKFRG